MTKGKIKRTTVINFAVIDAGNDEWLFEADTYGKCLDMVPAIITKNQDYVIVAVLKEGQGPLIKRAYKKVNGRFEHRAVVLKRDGALPPAGMHVHHVDGNKFNNDPSNLVVITPMEHKRLHAGWIPVNGEWTKQCKGCDRHLRINTENFYYSAKANPNYFHLCIECAKLRRKKRYLESTTTNAV